MPIIPFGSKQSPAKKKPVRRNAGILMQSAKGAAKGGTERKLVVSGGKPGAVRNIPLTRFPPGKVNPPSKPKRTGLRELVRNRTRGDNGY